MSAARWMMVAALLIGLDQLSKLVIVNSYALGQQTVLTSWFNIGLGVIAVAVLAFLMIRHAGQVLFSLAATLIISGAIGNTIDRLSYGYVVDFIDWHYAGWHWPAFNFADSFIMVGAGLFILDEIRRVRRG
jgi:signal peptidase II